jgi:acylphosphatase
MNHLSIKVSGKVQGVFFRASTKDMADEIGIKGFVRNESDGSVYIEAEADDERLNEFIAWCHHGPSHAVVENMQVEKGGSIQNFTKFEVRR